MSLKSTGFRQAVWSVSELISSQFFQLVIKLVLARLLVPADFGLIAMSLILVQGLNVILSLGMGDALIQRKELAVSVVHTVFWAEFFWGVFLAGVSFVSAPWIGEFFHDARVVQLTRVLSAGMVFSALAVLPNALLERHMRFFWRGVANVVSIVVFGFVAISLSLQGYGPWSLAVGQLSQSVVQCFLLYVLARPAIFGRFVWGDFWSMFRFGRHSVVVNILAWVLAYVDNAAVGRILGDASLGFYVMAFNIAELPVRGIHMVNTVFYSVYSKLQDDAQRLRASLALSMFVCVLFMTPLIAVVAVHSDTLVSVLLGDKWLPSAPLLVIFMVYSFFRALAGVMGYVLLAVNESRRVWHMQVVEVVFVLIALYPATVHFGLMGAALVMTLQRMIGLVLYAVMVSRLVGFTVGILLTALRPAAWALVMGAMMVAVKNAVTFKSASLIVSIFAGAVVFLALVWFFEGRFVKDVKENGWLLFQDLKRRMGFRMGSNKV